MLIGPCAHCRSVESSDWGGYAAIWRLPRSGHFGTVRLLSCIRSIVVWIKDEWSAVG